MANAVFIQNPSSIYKDEPGIRYHFPKMYLRRVQACVGDWVVFYEGKKGALGYTAIQRVASVHPDPDLPDHYFAELDLETLWDFEQVVPRNTPMGLAYEHKLRGADGRAMAGGYAVSAVRGITFDEFSSIVEAGRQPLDGPNALPREADAPGLAAAGFEGGGFEGGGFGEAPQTPFDYPGLVELRPEELMSRPARDRSFARMVKKAYDGKCAISGLDLRNGLGRAEVQAAHIRPVQHKGPDVVANGLALSATLHWMFDRGLISVGQDHEILVSDNKVSADVRQRLIAPSGKLHLPDNPRDHPHPEYLRYHRESIFGAAA